MDFAAAVIASKYIRCMLSLPPSGELLNICAAPCAAPRERREVVGAVQHLAGDLDPVVHEHGLHLRDHRPFGPKVRVAPVLGILGIAAPDVGDADTAGEPDRAVDDEHLAVRAVVHPVEVVPDGLVELADADSGVDHRRELIGVELAAAEPIEEDVDLDAGAGALRRAPRRIPGRSIPTSRCSSRR